jgi:hypothetical protein
MPDNDIGWGQGAVNNDIGWGKAQLNNTIGFGAIYENSPSGDTNIVGGQPVVSITYSESAFCADASDPTPTIQNNAGAGTFSSTAGLVFISTTTGEVDIDASTVGSYLITYTDTDSATATFNLTINALPTVIVSTSAGTICNGESTILTATGASTYVWNDGNTDNPRTVSPTTTTTFTATGTDSNGCTNTGATTITVNAQDSATFSYSANTYCANGTDPTPTITGTSGGAFTSTTGLSINASTGEIDLDASTVGTYSVTYTTTGVCPDNQSTNITINDADNAGFSYSASSYEPTDADPTPTITGLTGGTFSGTTGLVINSTTGEIDLSASTIASHTITYDTTSSGSSVCPNTSTQTVEIALAGIANNYSMNFDSASSDYIESSSSGITGNQNRTISVWAKATSVNNKTIICLGEKTGTATASRFGIILRDLQKIQIITYANDVIFDSSFNWGTINLNDGNWHHYLVTFESGNTFKLYVDNTYIGIKTASASSLNTGSGLFIGAASYGAGPQRFFDGLIDEVGIWNTVLTSTQVAEIYNGTSTNLTKDLTTVSGSNLVYFNRMGD